MEFRKLAAAIWARATVDVISSCEVSGKRSINVPDQGLKIAKSVRILEVVGLESFIMFYFRCLQMRPKNRLWQWDV